MIAHTLISGTAVVEAVLTEAKGIVTVLPETADTPKVRAAEEAGLSQVIKLQLQVAAVTVTARVCVIPG